MRDIIIILFLGFLVLSSCLDSDLSTTDKIANARISYLDDQGSFDHLVNDPYRIIGISPREDEWTIVLEYSGGCKSHRFSAVALMNADSVQQVRLYHHGDNDNCEALVRDSVRIAMREVFEFWDEYLDVEMINASNEQRIIIDPILASIPQGKECNLDVTPIRKDCVNSAVDSQLLLLSDFSEEYPEIWLQPVRNETGYDRFALDETYNVGVTLVFGLNYDRDAASTSCSLPQPIIPVILQCAVQ